MKLRLEQLANQVLVITGASSGIGRATARRAAERGARLVLAARNEAALHALAGEIGGGAARATFVVADVARAEDVRRIARAAEEAFGGFDTWVNNAGVGLYGRITETPVDDMRRLFDTNLWGVVHGSLEAVRHLRERGGALINVGSTLSERAIPLQGVYAASKHAVKGFTDALRMELEEEGAPISVTLIKPGAIDTPFPLNAKSYLASEPQHVPPVYAPDAVARAILHCAERPVRELFVGGGAKALSVLGNVAPRLADRILEGRVTRGTESARPRRPPEANALERPSPVTAVRGDYPGHVAKSSLYTRASLHPLATGAALAALLALAAFAARGRHGALPHGGSR
jgi:short-subunit dehydrogenase